MPSRPHATDAYSLEAKPGETTAALHGGKNLRGHKAQLKMVSDHVESQARNDRISDLVARRKATAPPVSEDKMIVKRLTAQLKVPTTAGDHIRVRTYYRKTPRSKRRIPFGQILAITDDKCSTFTRIDLNTWVVLNSQGGVTHINADACYLSKDGKMVVEIEVDELIPERISN